MGSTEEDSGGPNGWWESPSLSLADLRQQSESWNLGGDAATASLLQSMSQRLVSRTHEVEGILQNVLEETDRLSASIMNTSNAFHMLANTQFIENRTYQDDADVTKREVPETKTKSPPTEEEVISRCKEAITLGIDLVGKSYERHEIQDSDSEDEIASPVPVYALIDPYENKPLPYVIGSQLFMEDSRIGLLEPSSEENSKDTVTPDDTDSEEEIDELRKNKPIPASSSKITDDDDSDSDMSDEGFDGLAKNHVQNSHRGSSSLLSADDDDDDDEEYFKPSSKATQKITSNGPSLTSELNKRLGNNASAAGASNNRGLVFDSESDEDGDMFKKRDSPGDLFGNPPRIPSLAPGEDANDSSVARTGVENVRAMPNPTKVQNRKQIPSGKSDIFGSDSDEDGDLFSSKPRSASVVSKSSNKPLSHGHATKSAPQPKISASLFSSDGDEEEEEEGGLFAAKSSASHVHRAAEEEQVKEESPPLKSSDRKIPVGGVSIFGSAITSALRKQAPDSEASDNNSDWDDEEPPIPAKAVQNDTSSSLPQKQESKPSNDLKQPSKPVKSSGGQGLFDDDDDDDLFGTSAKPKDDLFGASAKPKDDLFGSSVAKPKAVNTKASQDDMQPNSSLSSGISVNYSERKAPRSEVATTHQTSKVEKKPVIGIFSDEDDDDDLFGFGAGKENAPSFSSVSQPSSKSSDVTKQTLSEKKPHSAEKVPSKTADNKLVTAAVEIPAKPKSQSSGLFSSPSDDDLFSPPPLPQATKTPPMVTTQPPPLPDTSAEKSPSDLFGSPSSDSGLFGTPVSVSPKPSKSIEKVTSVKSHDRSIEENVKEKPPPIVPSNIFSSPSDEDDLFSVPSSGTAKKSEASSVSQNNLKNSAPGAKADKDSNKSTDIIKDTSQKLDLKSDDDDIFAPKKTPGENLKKTPVASEQPKVDSKPKLNLFASVDEEDDIFSDLVPKSSKKAEVPSSKVTQDKSKKVSLFDSPESEDDIFAPIPNDISKKAVADHSSHTSKVPLLETDDDDIFSTPKSQNHSKTSEVLSQVKPSLGSKETPPPLLPDPNDTLNFKKTQETDLEKDKPVVKKKPVGGVAILPTDAQIFKQTKETDLEKDKPVVKKMPVGGIAILPTDAQIFKQTKEADIEKDKPIVKKKPVGGVAILPTDAQIFKQTKEADIEKDKPIVKKKPVGGVAILPTPKSEVEANQPKAGDTEVIGTKEEHKDVKEVIKAPPVGKESIKKDSIFDADDDDDIFGLPPSVGVAGRTSPPPLPTEAASSQSVNHSDDTQSKSTSAVSIKDDSLPPLNILSKNQAKTVASTLTKTKTDVEKHVSKTQEDEGLAVEEIHDEDKEKSEAKTKELPKKKPPVGGVSMFGGGGLGGSELFAKVKQRKSMLAPESDEDEDDSLASSSLDSKIEESSRSASKSSLSSLSESLSPRSPLSPPPMGPSSPLSKASSTESAVSFEDPVQNEKLLHSVNKSRVRGNKQRRPPSRAHRRGEAPTTAPSVTSTAAPTKQEATRDIKAFQSSVDKGADRPSASSLSSKESLAKVTDKIADVTKGKTTETDRPSSTSVSSKDSSTKASDIAKDVTKGKTTETNRPSSSSVSSKDSSTKATDKTKDVTKGKTTETDRPSLSSVSSKDSSTKATDKAKDTTKGKTTETSRPSSSSVSSKDSSTKATDIAKDVTKGKMAETNRPSSSSVSSKDSSTKVTDKGKDVAKGKTTETKRPSSSSVSSKDSLTKATDKAKGKVAEVGSSKVEKVISKSPFGDETEEDDDDLFGKPRSASTLSKSSGSGKKVTHSRVSSSSLFGDNSDDDNLFGASKPNSSSSSNVQAKVPQATTRSIATKPSSSKGLFSDDDDDMFTSTSKDSKPIPSNTSKASSSVGTSANPKSTLKPSSEPFEDPLLGNLK